MNVTKGVIATLLTDEEPMTLQEIAKIVGCSAGNIHYYRRILGFDVIKRSRFGKSGSSEKVLARLAELYPCQVIPNGGLTKVGKEFGISRERVRQIARQFEYGKTVKKVQPLTCNRCGTAMDTKKKSGACDDCVRPLVICDGCGVEFRLEPHRLGTLRRNQKAGNPGHLFHDRECWQKNQKRVAYGPETRAKMSASSRWNR